ncbi:MAG TPA: hypothetical protein VD971_09590 [Phycisphaerales bacterium]|nr:hypothetical protein [Phycisphaerales bacterium]
MTRDSKVQLVAGAVLVLCLAAATALSVQLSSIAGRARLSYADRAEDGDRWEVSLGIALGAFRGVFVNTLWMRANDKKEEGKFYESVELAKAITRLQPRFPRVWVFHAWNLAYNISVETHTREERWNWVNQGIALLRDQAIPANPDDLLIHKELAWIFAHKIQGYTDDANPYYKRMLAREWTIVLGAPPARSPEDRDRDKAIEKYAVWLQGFADAPATLDEAEAAQPGVKALLARIRADVDDFDLDSRDGRFELLRRITIVDEFVKSSRRFYFDKVSGPKTKALTALRTDPANAAAWDALVRHLRRRVLVEDYHMEPDRMIRYTRKYGPIDWRHGAAHSLYWAARGVERSLTTVTRRTEGDYDFINTDRVVAQSVQQLFRTGELYFDFRAMESGLYTLWQGVNNPHFVQAYGDILDELRKRGGVYDAQTRERGFSPLSDAYQNFLIDVTLFFYRRGQIDEAEKWLEKLRTFDDMNLTDPTRYKRFADVRDFVAEEGATRATVPDFMINQVSASLMGAYVSGLLGQDPDLFLSQFNYARQFHAYYFQKQNRQTAVNTEMGRMAQLDPDFEFVAGMLYTTFMQGLGLEDLETAYTRSPSGLRVWVYDDLVTAYKEVLDKEAAEGGRPFDIVFPKPDGLEQHRAYLEEKFRDLSKGPSELQRK